MPHPAGFNRHVRANGTWAALIPVSLGMAAVSLLCFSWLSEEVLEQGTSRFDDRIRSLVHQHASPLFTVIMRFVTNLGDWPVILFGTIVLLFIFWYRKDGDHVRLLLVTMLGAGILDGVLKLAFHRPRPNPFFVAKPSTYSFPSGHALISLCFYGLIAGMLSLRLHKHWQRVAVWGAAGLTVGLIGLSRIYLGVHWPSDVLAGYAAALIWMGAVRVLARKMEERRTPSVGR
jgi:membrane-associated phospholipid phosphatase